MWGVMSLRMEGILLGMNLIPQSSWVIWFQNRIVVISDEMIAQIRATLTEKLGWFKEELG